MDGGWISYLLTPWALGANALALLTFGLKAYDIWAKTWMAGSGKHKVEGKITYTEFRSHSGMLPKIMGGIPNEGMICFAYYIDNQLYTGTLPLDTLSQAQVDNSYQPGQKIDIYFSPRAPQYAFPNSPPSRTELVRKAVERWLLIPIALINIPGIWIWALLQQTK